MNLEFREFEPTGKHTVHNIPFPDGMETIIINLQDDRNTIFVIEQGVDVRYYLCQPVNAIEQIKPQEEYAEKSIPEPDQNTTFIVYERQGDEIRSYHFQAENGFEQIIPEESRITKKTTFIPGQVITFPSRSAPESPNYNNIIQIMLNDTEISSGKD